MDHSRAVTARGLRPLPRAGWRSDVPAALAVVARSPRLWLLGMLGFSLRGGILILTLPVLILPTQVEVRFMLGANLGTAGLTPQFFVLAGVAGVIAAALALLALLVVAMVDAASFEQLVGGARLVEEHSGRDPVLPDGTWRRLVGRAYAVQVAALVAIAAVALPLVAAVNQAIIDELLRPTSDGSIYQRVIFDVRNPLFLLVAAFLLIELFSSAAERELFTRAAGLHASRAAGRLPGISAGPLRAVTRPLRSPLRTIAAAAAGWLMWVAVIPVVVGTLGFAWQQVEAAFLALPPANVPALLHLLALFLVALLLAAAFVAGLFVFGVISAVRAALWTVAGLR